MDAKKGDEEEIFSGTKKGQVCKPAIVNCVMESRVLFRCGACQQKNNKAAKTNG